MGVAIWGASRAGSHTAAGTGQILRPLHTTQSVHGRNSGLLRPANEPILDATDMGRARADAASLSGGSYVGVRPPDTDLKGLS